MNFSSGWFYRVSPSMVLGAGHSPDGCHTSEKVLWIDGGKAFPLGHPTTRLCLDLLTATLAEKPCQNLVEVGCGTGVLCIAAAALGTPQVIGLDIHSQAVQATRMNARNNGLAGAVDVIEGSSECLQGPFDLVAANLPWEVQLEKVTELCRLAATDGRLLLSGFRDNQEGSLLEKFQEFGWRRSRRLVKYFSHPELPLDISFNWVAWLLIPA